MVSKMQPDKRVPVDPVDPPVAGGVVSPPPRAWDIDCSKEPSRTKQEFAADCDVNLIIARCLRQGLPLPGPEVQAVFADVSEVGDFSDAMRRVTAAQEAFASLAPELRREFDNDPAKLLSFLQDEKNRPRAIELGLVAKPPEPVVPVVSPVVPPAK